ncbi:hypothetical protein TIFTF001_031895 [Ficus carica]|uniref:Uncharacterized protein n=1 Tax=Ficus carica TaxID=3494 RepID=A0AA88DVS6_FICCA|nr:hypothetical protein TIFTF001_031895 [Ficus carica]
MDLPKFIDRQNNDDNDAPYLTPSMNSPSPIVPTFSAESKLSPETSSPAVTALCRRYASGTFPNNELINSRSDSSVTSEVGSIVVTEEVFAVIKKVGNYWSLEENGDKSELTQNNELSTVTTASQVFLDDSVDSVAERDDDSL